MGTFIARGRKTSSMLYDMQRPGAHMHVRFKGNVSDHPISPWVCLCDNGYATYRRIPILGEAG